MLLYSYLLILDLSVTGGPAYCATMWMKMLEKLSGIRSIGNRTSMNRNQIGRHRRVASICT